MNERLAPEYPFTGTRVEHIADLWPTEERPGFYCPVEIDGKRSWHCVTPNGHAGLTKETT